MKKFYSLVALMLGTVLSFSACGDDNDDPTPDDPTQDVVDPIDLDYTAENAASWGNYMLRVSSLLKEDAQTLYAAWSEDYNGAGAYAETFKKHSGSDYPTALSCVQEIVAKCSEIANEVGAAKIGDPLNLYNQGKTTEALYAVESWYSWHSRDDYTNNIWSIRNSYYGIVSENDSEDQGDIQENSLYRLIEAADPEMNQKVDDAIHAAAVAIQAIPQPFRNHINSEEALAAQQACLDLEEILIELNTYIANQYDGNANDARLEAIVEQYVDYVVLPTYKSLAEQNTALYNAIEAFQKSPGDASFEAACDAWLTAREPWEKSEGFLFGPVDSEGLDPNMDSWPLDQDMIVNILESGNFDELEWDNIEDSEDAQNVRGFHTLEYLLFKNGEPRTIQ